MKMVLRTMMRMRMTNLRCSRKKGFETDVVRSGADDDDDGDA